MGNTTANMSPEERRAHVLPATRARRFNAAKRAVARLIEGEPRLDAEQLRDLAWQLEAAAREADA